MFNRLVCILITAIVFALPATSELVRAEGPTQLGDLKIGDPIVDLRFKDIRGLNRSLADLGKKRAYVFVFTTTQCPLVRRSIPKLVDLDQRFGPQGVQFMAINVGLEETLRDVAAQGLDFEASFPLCQRCRAFVREIAGCEADARGGRSGCR